MRPEAIEELLDKMLEESDGDIMLEMTTWAVAEGLTGFYMQVDVEIYSNDPMSEFAPSECFALHMKPWEKLKNRLDQNIPHMKRKVEQVMNAKPWDDWDDIMNSTSEVSEVLNKGE